MIIFSLHSGRVLSVVLGLRYYTSARVNGVNHLQEKRENNREKNFRIYHYARRIRLGRLSTERFAELSD